MLRDIKFELSYRSDRNDIAREFFERALAASDFYDRAAGYFTSTMLQMVSRGLTSFIKHGGRMRLVASPFLSEEDVDAIARGYASRETIVEQSLETTIRQLEDIKTGFATKALSWLVAANRLEIRIAIAKASSGGGIFHEKIGIFRDGADAVAFIGSANETGASLTINFESIDVYRSWTDPDRVAQKITDFEKLWHDHSPLVDVMPFPEALSQRLINLAPSEPPLDGQTGYLPVVRRPLRPYQNSAISAWSENGYRGILSMATGTGKTITALEAARLSIELGCRTVVIHAPLKHLVEQWVTEVNLSLHLDPIVCHSEIDWPAKLQMAALAAEAKPQRVVVVISTYATGKTIQFRQLLSRLPNPKMIVADEVHNITPDIAAEVLTDEYTNRLALSATPQRYMDEVGTQLLLDYFNGIVFEFGLGDAINAGYLTPYVYEPVFCDLTDEEEVKYQKIASDLAEVSKDNIIGQRDRRIQMLMQKRATLIMKAKQKLEKFEDIIKNSDILAVGFTLVYCYPEIVDIVQNFIGVELHLRSHKFTADEPQWLRKELLDRFARNDLKALVAIRCLDEGIDVPATRTAFILASSSNPREFVQRRGRVLRVFPDKREATIYDFVVLPRQARNSDQRLLEREIARFYHFAKLAINRNQAMLALEKVAAARHLVIPPE